MSNTLTVKEKKAYLKNSGACPKCHSTAILGESIDVEGNITSQAVTCANCDFAWRDIYQLVDVLVEH